MRLAFAAMLLVACSRGDVQNQARVADSAPAPSASPGTAKAACPATGQWAPCSVVERLDRSGLAPRVDSAAVDEKPLTPNGTLVHLGLSDVELYFYPNVAAREREQAKLDKTKYIDYSAPVTLKGETTLITSANLIAILHSRNDHQRERVSDAITAGPPQPSHP